LGNVVVLAKVSKANCVVAQECASWGGGVGMGDGDGGSMGCRYHFQLYPLISLRDPINLFLSP